MLALTACSGSSQQTEPEYPPASQEPPSGPSAEPGLSESQTHAPQEYPGAAAGSAPPAAPGQPTPGASSQVSDSELASFARAYGQIAVIQQSYQQQAEATTSPDEVQALQQGMNSEVEAALQAEGVSSERFGEFMRDLEQDPQLRARFERALQEQTQPPGATQ